MALVRDKLVIGEDLGEVPPDVPVVPLAADLAREQKRLRFAQARPDRGRSWTCASPTTARSRGCCTG